MKRLLIISLLVFLLISLIGCGNQKEQSRPKKINISYPGMEILFLTNDGRNWYLNNENKYSLYSPTKKELQDTEYLEFRKAFFINENLAGFINKAKLSFFDLKKKKIIREVDCYSRLGKKISSDILVAPKDKKGNLFILNKDSLYEYNYNKDALKDLPIEKKDKWEWYGNYKMMYYEKENLLLLDVFNPVVTEPNESVDFEIYQISLNNYEVTFKTDGLINDYVKKEGRIYSVYGKEIRYISLDDFKRTTLWKGKWPIVDISVVDEDLIWILYNNDEKTRDMELLIGGKRFVPDLSSFGLKNNNCHGIKFRVTDELKKKLKDKYID